mgnify:CR=1 FL=1
MRLVAPDWARRLAADGNGILFLDEFPDIYQRIGIVGILLQCGLEVGLSFVVITFLGVNFSDIVVGCGQPGRLFEGFEVVIKSFSGVGFLFIDFAEIEIGQFRIRPQPNHFCQMSCRLVVSLEMHEGYRNIMVGFVEIWTAF